MVQGGDPITKDLNKIEAYGTGGPGYKIQQEFNQIPHNRGILSMARAAHPDSAGSQFFIMVDNAPFLNNQYTVFGAVISGMDVVDKIVNLKRNERDLPDERVEMKMEIFENVKYDMTNNSENEISSKTSFSKDLSFSELNLNPELAYVKKYLENSDDAKDKLFVDKVVVLKTEYGDIVIGFFKNAAPNHVDNFINLCKQGFYNGCIFHRVIPGFMIQGGDPNTKDINSQAAYGTGGPGYMIKQEFNPIPHDRGILSMARAFDPDSAGSQFFIMVKKSSFLDNQYTVFGAVISGMDVVDKIVNLPRNQADLPYKRAIMKMLVYENGKMLEIK